MQAALKCWIALFALMQISMFFDNSHSGSVSNPLSSSSLNDAFEQVSISHMVANASPGLKLLWIVGGAIGIAITLIWIKLFSTHTRQNKLAKICGVLLLIAGTYLFGTLMPMTVIGHFAEVPWQVQQMIPSMKTPPSLFSALNIAIGGIALLVASYALCFGKKARYANAGARNSNKLLNEKDNMGTRQDTLSLASSYWMARNASQKFEPYVLYTFEKEGDAREALLSLDCIHLAKDTGKLICTETLIFGYYSTDEGRFEAIVCGQDLTHELWEAAKESFARHNGKRKNDQEPDKASKSDTKVTKPKLGKAVFVREDRKQDMGHTMIYRIHKAPDAASAKAFLEKNPVTQRLYYIVVETPEGNYCRDIQGIYKE